MNIGLIAGNFDLIHPGYIQTFKEMAEREETIWVLLDCNNMENRPHKLKPILSAEDRTNTLLQIKGISHVIPYKTENELLEILTNLPHIYPQNSFTRYLGNDYKDKNPNQYTNLPTENLVFLNRNHGWSTTKLKKMITHSVCQTPSYDGRPLYR